MDASEGLEMTNTMEDDDEEDDNLLRVNNDDDDGDNDESDDDDDDSSFWTDLLASWQQHLFAIVVAIVATIVAYFFHTKVVLQRTTPPPSYGRRQHHREMTTMLPKHLRLQNFRRTGNLSFCGFHEDVATLAEKQLKVMDFRLPSELTSSMELHFWADDDDETLINALDILKKNDRHDMVSISMDHEQINCMRRMSLDATRHSVKGVSYYYQKPSIASLYQQSDDQITMTSSDIGQAPPRKKLQEAYVSFTGFAAKFVNLHREAVLLFWDGRHASDRQLVGEIPPFQSLTTATRPGESFSISPVHDPSSALARWVVTVDDAVQYYEPEQQQQQHLHQTYQLTAEETHLLNFQKINREFAKDYLIQAKRTWLANFPRPLPVHPMWPASYLGQRHHQVDESSSPPVLSLEVVSVLPRVFRIDNFLTADECQALIDLAIGHGMTASTVYAGGTTGDEGAFRMRNTRSSFNSWLKHNVSDVTDVIYRKAARIFQVDTVSPTRIDDRLDAHRHSLVESLQVVRYKKGEQYTPHHDWVVPPVQHRFQPTRFATLLMYLNDDFEGGETNFPRAVTSNQHDGVSISPIKGSAVLFYNVLPDGNVDDLSQHGSSLVTKGVKYAANLWLWEPHIN